MLLHFLGRRPGFIGGPSLKFVLGSAVFACALMFAGMAWYLWPPPSPISLVPASDDFLNRRAASLPHLLALRPGMAKPLVARRLGTKLYTECLIKGSLIKRAASVHFRIDGVYVALPTKVQMQHSDSWDYFWLIFKNGKFERTIEPVRAPMVEYPYEGTTADRLGDWGPTDFSRVKRALAAPGLTSMQLRTDVTAPIPHGNPGNLFPAAMMVRLVMGHWRMVAASEREARQIENTARLAARYEPSGVQLGMARDRVGELFQSALRSWPLGAGESASIYGAAKYVDESPLWNGTRFAIIFDHQKAVVVLGSAFYNNDWCRKRGKQKGEIRRNGRPSRK